MDVRNGHRESKNTKLYEIGSGTKLLFTFLSLKVSPWGERDTIFYIVSFQPNQHMVPVVHKVVWPCPALKVNLLLPRWELNQLPFLKSQPMLPVRDVTQIPWSQLLSGIFILTSLNDTSSPHTWTPALMLHLTNPCAKQKVLILTKLKGKIYKRKSLRHYITPVWTYEA